MDDWSVQALSKVLSLMPPRLRRQMDAVASQTESPGPWEGAPVFDAAVLTTLAQACRDSELLRFDYTAREAEVTHRRVEPLRLVSLGPPVVPRRLGPRPDGLAQLPPRPDRRTRSRPASGSAPRDLPADDALAFVQQGIRRMPQRYAVRVRRGDAGRRPRRPGRAAGAPSPPTATGCVLEMNVDDLDWPVMVLAGSGARLRRRVAARAGREGRRGRRPLLPDRGELGARSAGAGASSASTTHSEGRGTDRIERLDVSRTASSADATTSAVMAVVPPWCSSR